jgi:hypothetical protein
VAGVVTLAHALAEGGRVVWEPADKPRLRVAERWAEGLHREADEVREVLRRAAMFRHQLGTSAGGPIIPYLALPDAPAPRLGACISCGGSAPRWRCLLCLAAVYIALDLPQRLAEIGTPDA